MLVRGTVSSFLNFKIQLEMKVKTSAKWLNRHCYLPRSYLTLNGTYSLVLVVSTPPAALKTWLIPIGWTEAAFGWMDAVMVILLNFVLVEGPVDVLVFAI